MSISCMTWAWNLNGLKPAQKLVLMKLADHANDEGICWPGKSSVADACGISKRSLDAIIEYLAQRNLIKVERRRSARSDQLNDTNLYYLQIAQRELFEPAVSGAEIALGKKLPQCKNEGGVVQKPTESDANFAPEPPLNHQLEPLDLSSSGDEVQKQLGYESKKGKKLSGEVLTRFLTFWEAFGYKAGKSEAADAWLEQVEPRFVNRLVTMDHILAAAKAEALNRPKALEAGLVPKMAQGWLHARRWEDREPDKGVVSAEPKPWYHTLSGVHEEAGNRGILQQNYPDQAELMLALINDMQAKGEEVPKGLRDYRIQLLKQDLRQSA